MSSVRQIRLAETGEGEVLPCSICEMKLGEYPHREHAGQRQTEIAQQQREYDERAESSQEGRDAQDPFLELQPLGPGGQAPGRVRQPGQHVVEDMVVRRVMVKDGVPPAHFLEADVPLRGLQLVAAEHGVP
jgi:hypothetical protein